MAKVPAQKTPLIFFKTQGGTEPVLDWLKDLLARKRLKELKS